MDNNLSKEKDEVLARLIEELEKLEKLEEDEEYDAYHDYSYHNSQNEYEGLIPLIEERYKEDMNKSLNLRDDEDEVKSRERSGSLITNEDLTYSPVLVCRKSVKEVKILFKV